MQVPETHCARVGDLRIAYQQWGDGPPLMICPALISNIEIWWEHELYRRTLEHMGKHMTCVTFDKRGIGLSDRFDEAPTLEQRNEDIMAVMDAVGLLAERELAAAPRKLIRLDRRIDHTGLRILCRHGIIYPEATARSEDKGRSCTVS